MNCNYCYSFEQIYSSQNVYNEYVNSIAIRFAGSINQTIGIIIFIIFLLLLLSYTDKVPIDM